MLKRLKDLGSFTLPIQICENDMVHTLSDLGASINLMTLMVFYTLGLEKPRPSSMVL